MHSLVFLSDCFPALLCDFLLHDMEQILIAAGQLLAFTMSVHNLGVALEVDRTRAIRARRRRRHWVHPLNLVRPEAGQFVILFSSLREHPERFFEYCRMSVSRYSKLMCG